MVIATNYQDRLDPISISYTYIAVILETTKRNIGHKAITHDGSLNLGNRVSKVLDRVPPVLPAWDPNRTVFL